tara:strand:+ start:4624 stop:5976 length:1353 start_codon:yes stop_codon:yes gene_type:complete
MSELSIESQIEIKITEAVISSDRTPVSVDIKNLISDFEIYENIVNPYLTANIIFVDQENIVQDMDLQGGEKLTFSFYHVEEMNKGVEIKKEFVIDSIKEISKAGERDEVVRIHCTEFIGLISSLQNVNRVYTGAPSEIIAKIMSEFLNRDLIQIGNDSLKDMKVIIPNMHPIEACQWLIKRTLTKEGFPFFLFSTIGVDNLILKDLGTMLSQQPINKKIPYFYAPSLVTTKSIQSYYAIQDYEYSDTENLIGLIREGLVGAKYNFYSTLTALEDPIKFNVDRNVFKRLAQQNSIGANNTRYNYAPDYRFNDIAFQEYESKNISSINSSGAYTTKDSVFKSYHEESTKGSNIKKVIEKSLRGFLGKTPLRMTVRGRDFVTADNNYSIGKTIRINFLDTNPLVDTNAAKLDEKKSGDYIIVEARHNYRIEKFDTTLLCAKIGSIGEQQEMFA